MTSMVTDYGTPFADTIELLQSQLHPVALTLAKTGKATFVKKSGSRRELKLPIYTSYTRPVKHRPGC
jgi:hypothetical protein